MFMSCFMVINGSGSTNVCMGVVSNRQEEAIASSWILQNENDQVDQLFSLQKTTRR